MKRKKWGRFYFLNNKLCLVLKLDRKFYIVEKVNTK
jgi:hypothetical protein